MKRKLLLIMFSLSFIATGFNNIKAQENEKSISKVLLETFCQDYYSECFTNRTYVKYSLTITNWEMVTLRTAKVRGLHTYKGRFGVSYENMPFEAYIKFGVSSAEITFKKRSKADFFNPEDYWESCDKKIFFG